MMGTSRTPWTDAVLVGHDHIETAEQRLTNSFFARLVAATSRALRQSVGAAGCGEAQGLMGRDRQLTTWVVFGGAGVAVAL